MLTPNPKTLIRKITFRFFWIITASIFFRVIVFIRLPDSHSSLAPDEGTYASLAKWVGDSKPVDEFPIFSGGVYRSGRAFILPASFLYRLGIDPLDAVRLVSNFYAVALLVTVCIFAALLLKANSTLKSISIREVNLITGLIAILAFLPSHYLWSTLGLRESSNEFWLVLAYLSLFLFLNAKSKLRLPSGLGVFFAVVMTYTTRVQVGWVLSVSLLIFAVLRMKKSGTILLISLITLGTLAGYSLNQTSKDFKSINLSNPDINLSNPEKSESSSVNLFAGAISEVSGAISGIPTKHKDNQFGAESKIETQNCPIDETITLGKYACLVYRSPLSALTFLFRPIPIIDTTSTSSLFAAGENLLWMLLFGLIAYRIVRFKRVNFFQHIAPSLIFLFLYVVGAGAYEGNMGTAFRHKSLILWIVLLLVFAVFWRVQDKKK